MVLQGEMVMLLVGSYGYIIQVLGGSYIVFVEGNLFCIVGKDGDVIGKELLLVLEFFENVFDEEVEKLVWQQLCICFDFEILFNIVDLGLVYEVDFKYLDDGWCEVDIKMMFIVLGCGMGEILVDDVCSKLEMILMVVEVDVELVFDLLWGCYMMFEVVWFEIGML